MNPIVAIVAQGAMGAGVRRAWWSVACRSSPRSPGVAKPAPGAPRRPAWSQSPIRNALERIFPSIAERCTGAG